MAIIYKTTNKINNKIYIGVHSGSNPQYMGSGEKLTRALKKYGREHFIRETLKEYDTIEEAYLNEATYITQYNTRDDNIGYNIHPGGNGSSEYTCSQERKDAISVGRKKAIKEKGQVPWNKGQTMSQEFKNSVSNGLKNKPGAIRTGKDNIFGQIKFSGTDNWNAKIYKVVSPDGIEYTVAGKMTQFCIDHDLSIASFHYTRKSGSLATQRSKNYGWQVIWPN